jgi:hypothetical protein
VCDQVHIVDLKQVNHALIQPRSLIGVGPANKSELPAARRWPPCSKNTDSNRSRRPRNSNVENKPRLLAQSKSDPPHHNTTTRARQFGIKP